MATWSIYISPEEEKLLRNKIESIAEKRRWSFSQAVSGILKEILVDKRPLASDKNDWGLMTAHSFFDGYPEKDSAYDNL